MSIPQTNKPEIEQAIRNEISAYGPVTFRRFMELALYHPEHGYYNSANTIIGRSGDYYTSLSLGAWFGILIADQIAEMWEIIGKPDDFRIIEGGAGHGLLCCDVLQRLHECHPDCYSVSRYIINERSSAMINKQKEQVSSCGFMEKTEWKSEDETDSYVGVYISNELVDAFPVHQVEMTDSGLFEKHIDFKDNHFVFCNAPVSCESISSYFDRFGISLEKGQIAEVNLDAEKWIGRVANSLSKGFIISIDYGYTAEKLYGPSRKNGTLMCYYRHNLSEDPLSNIGNQDITSHVNFSSLILAGKENGLMTAGFTNQSFFLINLGLPALASAIPPPDATPQQLLNRNFSIKKLINPDGLGRNGVLIQYKGLSEPPFLSGLKMLP